MFWAVGSTGRWDFASAAVWWNRSKRSVIRIQSDLSNCPGSLIPFDSTPSLTLRLKPLLGHLICKPLTPEIGLNKTPQNQFNRIYRIVRDRSFHSTLHIRRLYTFVDSPIKTIARTSDLVISLFDPNLNFRIDSIDPDLYIISFFFNYIITTIAPNRYQFISFFFINILALITPDRTAWSLWVYHLDQSGSNDINTLSASADLLLIK
ncbi:hypothetical protein PGTUg99_016397 [Puccinia graminis f. sp. tritici]|uniref:Uncharacterized protein n=1 Tax=Puccinia graminis f. sp. tritici TaxID=56615 RepID=A0A5B0P141_PUCGR|nr:hypothetical protein PGTUg99_016397 [Puccinia graminis f. sp. tritici]